MEGGELTLEETAAATGATIRNIKYWTVVYELEVNRKGRRNFYPRRTVDLLRAITRLAELQVHSTHFTRWLVDLALGRAIGEAERYARFEALCSEIGETLGVALPRRPEPPARSYLHRSTGKSESLPFPDVSHPRRYSNLSDAESRNTDSPSAVSARRRASRDDESLL